MVIGIEELRTRVDKIEEQKNQEILTLVEILSNATFFGEIKKANCEYAKNGQCGYFVLKRGRKKQDSNHYKMPNKELRRTHSSLPLRNIKYYVQSMSKPSNGKHNTLQTE